MIILITGPPGAGKTTIARALAKQLHQSALIETDLIRGMIRNGRAYAWEKTSEAKKQIRLATQNTVQLALQFHESGYVPIIDDVALGDVLKTYQKELKKTGLVTILLLPDLKRLQKRDTARGRRAMGDRAIELYKRFSKAAKIQKWIVLDSTCWSVQETVNRIVDSVNLE